MMPDTEDEDIILRVEALRKNFLSGGQPLEVLKNVSFTVSAGSTASIVGPSGSGKTTLLGLCAGLDEATSGMVSLNGRSWQEMNEDQRAAWRNRWTGFVFQNFQLLPTLTAIENVMVPLELRGERDCRDLARELLSKVGLGDRGNHYPVQLSGGEQQRVALARAFINKPRLLFADEPTGNLDGKTSHNVADLLFELNREAGTTLVLVTHDLELAKRTQTCFRIDHGELSATPF